MRAWRLILASTVLAAMGCDQIEELLGTAGDEGPDRLRLQSLEIGGPATATVGTTVRFTATGTFINLDDNDAEVERDLTSAVLWVSTTSAVGVPGGDGRMLVQTTGATTIRATTPEGEGTEPQQSNDIAFVATTGTGS